MPGTSGVRFEVECPSILQGQRIGVCGSSEELGSWDPNKCLELVSSEESFSKWLAPHRVKVDAFTKFKFIALSPDGDVSWEDGSDRELPPLEPSHGPVRLSSVFNSRQQSVMLDGSPTAVVAEEIDQPGVEASTKKFVNKVPSSDAKAGAHLDEPEGERSPSHRAQSSTGLQTEREEAVTAVVPMFDVHEAEGTSALCASQALAPTVLAKGVASIGDESKEMPSAEGVQKAETHEPPLAADTSPTSEEDGLMQSSGVWLKEDRAALGESADAVVQLIRRRASSLGILVGGPPGRAARLTAVGAVAGGVALGAGGAVTGLTMGSFVGVACGLLPAVVTFGLSVPIGAALGGGAGLGLGATLGTTAGAAGGGMVGYRLAKQTEGKVEVRKYLY